jgi:hypothetical protein
LLSVLLIVIRDSIGDFATKKDKKIDRVIACLEGLTVKERTGQKKLGKMMARGKEAARRMESYWVDYDHFRRADFFLNMYSIEEGKVNFWWAGDDRMIVKGMVSCAMKNEDSLCILAGVVRTALITFPELSGLSSPALLEKIGEMADSIRPKCGINFVRGTAPMP